MAPNLLKNLSPSEKFVYEWQYRMLGGFGTSLAEAIARADSVNTAKIALGFPDEVSGIKRFQHEPGFWEGVQRKVSDAKQ